MEFLNVYYVFQHAFGGYFAKQVNLKRHNILQKFLAPSHSNKLIESVRGLLCTIRHYEMKPAKYYVPKGFY